jgi:hypothetical protein
MMSVVIAVFMMGAFVAGCLVGRTTRPKPLVPIRERRSVVLPTVFVEHPEFRKSIEREIVKYKPN